MKAAEVEVGVKVGIVGRCSGGLDCEAKGY